MKWLKFSLIGLGVVVLLFILVAVYFVATFDPNQYKDTLISVVKSQTGRDLTIDEDIGFTFFPRLGVQVGSLRLSNDPAFSGDEFLHVDRAKVNVDLLSILKGKVAADRIVLQGLSLHLIKNRSGKSNWESLSSTSEPAAGKTTESSTPALGIDIAGISISNASLVYRDEQAGTALRVDPFELETGPIGSAQLTPIQVKFTAIQEQPAIRLDARLATNAKLLLDEARYTLNDLSVRMDASGEVFPGGSIELLLSGAVDVNAKQESIRFAPLRLELSDITVDGDVGVEGFALPSVSFALNTDQLNLDALLPNENGDSAPEGQADSSQDDIELPIETLRDLNLKGAISIGKLIVAGITATEVDVNLHASDGLLSVNPLQLQLYEGKLLGQSSLDVRKATPVYAAKNELQGIEISGLMAALAEDGKAVIRGKSDLRFDISTRGKSVSALKNALSGSASFAASNGALVNEKLARNVERVVAFLKGREPKASGEELVFDSFTGSAKIVNGVATNDDLDLKTPLIYGRGQGEVGIATENMNYELRISLAEDSSRAIPIRIKGPFDDLGYSVDLKAALSEQQKQVVEEKKQEIKEEVDERLKEKLGDGVGEKLKNLKLF